MAGYMTKLQGYVYEGELVNGTTGPIENGSLVSPGVVEGALVMVKPTANANTKFLCKEARTIYDGITAYEFIVTALGAGTGKLYFVENGFDVNTSAAYDATLYSTEAGKFLRAHPLTIGDEFVTDKVTGTFTVGTEYTFAADGTITGSAASGG